MKNYYSIRLNLEEVLVDEKYQNEVIKKLKECAILSQDHFKVVFFHKGLSDDVCKKFFSDHGNDLWNINAEITKDDVKCWFTIDDNSGKGYRYQWKGEIIEGLKQYMLVVSHINRRDSN